MRALSVMQPWAWCIAEGHKLVENRTWTPAVPSGMKLGERIAIHASKSPQNDFIYANLQAENGGPLPAGVKVPATSDLVLGAIIATAKVTAFITVPDKLPPEQRAWFVGPWGWRLEDVRKVLEPVPRKGALGLWTLNADEAALVLGRQGESVTKFRQVSGSP